MMSDEAQVMQAPAPRVIGRINRTGLLTLVRKEVGRFLVVYMQTIVAPVITTLLFYVVFFLALGGDGKGAAGLSYTGFLAPGLIMMTMVQNAFANTSSSIMISKVQGNIVDVLMPPLSAGEIFSGYVAGGILRGLAVGAASMAALSFFVPVTIHSCGHVVLFSILGTMMLSSLGLAGGIWSQKFDHIAAVTNFVVTPMAFLSGTFYSINALPPFWREVVLYNPFFHMIDGFRYGMTGHADADIAAGIWGLVLANVVLAWACIGMIRSGYRLKS